MVLIGGIVAIVVIVGGAIWVLLRRRSHDDVHSVEHYHRQLHTLEEMRTHPTQPTHSDGDGLASYPSPAFRVGSGSPAVRLTDPNKPLVPPVPPPPVPAVPVQFDDERGGLVEAGESARPEAPTEVAERGSDETGPAADAAASVGTAAGVAGANGAAGASGARTAPVLAPSPRGEERAMHSIDHRPRRLGAPLAAIAAVAVLIVVLVVTGLHTSSPSHHGKGAQTANTTTTAPSHHAHHGSASTTTTVAPVVSAPAAATNHSATYQVADASYSLALSATSGECWVQATDGSGAVLFSGILLSGQSHTVPATGPVTVVAGAPNVFAATVNGSPVQLPVGFQSPFTLNFVSSTTGTATGGTGTGA
jgi:Domain of unknown function (DUF4115)